MTLYLRLSDTDLCAALYQPGRRDTFESAAYHLNPQVSLVTNLRDALAQVSLFQQPHDKVEVLANSMVTPVPLAEFQEEDAPCLWRYCFTHTGHERVFYDTVPAVNVVVLYALEEPDCQALEEVFGPVRFKSSLAAVIQHFATKALSVTHGKRMFVLVHGASVDVLAYEDNRLLTVNTYKVRALTDMAYYALNLAHHLGVDVKADPFFVAGETHMRDTAVHELQQYAARVYAVSPEADFNRHPISVAPGVPFDLMCALLK